MEKVKEGVPEETQMAPENMEEWVKCIWEEIKHVKKECVGNNSEFKRINEDLTKNRKEREGILIYVKEIRSKS